MRHLIRRRRSEQFSQEKKLLLVTATIIFLFFFSIGSNNIILAQQATLFEENFNSFSNWRPAANNGIGCEWTAENGWAKIKTMGYNPDGHIFAVYECDLPNSIPPDQDFSFKAFIRCQDGDPSGASSNTWVELVTAAGERVAMLMWDDSQASSGYGGIIFRYEGGIIYTNDPDGFGTQNPTINNELEIRRKGNLWTAYLDGQKLGSSQEFSGTRTATKVQIWRNKYRTYPMRDGWIDYIKVTTGNGNPLQSEWRIIDIAPVSAEVALKVVADSKRIFHLAWQEDDKIKYSRSFDNCLTWSTPVVLRTGVLKWHGIYIDKNDVLHIGYCVNGTFPNGPYYSYHFSSSDGGNTWSNDHIIHSGNYYNQLGGHSGMSISPDGTLLFGGDKAYDNHFYCKISLDKGITWSQLRSTQYSLPDTYGGRVVDMAFDANNNIHVLVWTWHYTWGGSEKIWYIKSTDYGITWSTPIYVCDFDRQKLPHIIPSINDPNMLYIFSGENSKKSPDGGQTWTEWTNIPEGLPLLDFKNNKMYMRFVNNGHYFYKISEDNGITWSLDNNVTTTATVVSMGLIGQVNGFFPYHYGKKDDNMVFIPFWIDAQPSTYYIRCAIKQFPPIANAGEDKVIEGTSFDGAEITLDGTASYDPNNYPLTYSWQAEGINFDDPHSPTPKAVFPLGTTEVTLIVNNGFMNSIPDTVKIQVVDTTPPEINVTASPDTLWPPNHKMANIFTNVSVNDLCDPTPEWFLLSIESNQPEEGPGRRNYPDIDDYEIGTQDTLFLLRAERTGKSERIYTIKYKAIDSSGNEKVKEVTVIVPHDRRKPGATNVNNLPSLSISNYPNPFNPETDIKFSIRTNENVTILIYNLLGQKIRSLLDQELTAGDYTIKWSGKDDNGNFVSGGIYICKIKTDSFQKTINMLLLK